MTDKISANNGQFKKGNQLGKENKRGPGKLTNLKHSFLEVYEKLGGTDGLYEWVDSNNRNKSQFYNMIHKMLPSNLTFGDEETNEIKLSIKKIVENMADDTK